MSDGSSGVAIAGFIERIEKDPIRHAKITAIPNQLDEKLAVYGER